MPEFRSKKLITERHADPVTMDHIIELRKENERLRHADDITLENLIKLRAENERLRLKYEEAINDIEEWGAYASEYFQEKWGLKECIEQHRDALKEAE